MLLSLLYLFTTAVDRILVSNNYQAFLIFFICFQFVTIREYLLFGIYFHLQQHGRKGPVTYTAGLLGGRVQIRDTFLNLDVHFSCTTTNLILIIYSVSSDIHFGKYFTLIANATGLFCQSMLPVVPLDIVSALNVVIVYEHINN